MSYTVTVLRRAEKDLRRRIHPGDAERIREAIAALADDPRPRDSRPMRGQQEGYRLQIGRDYRALYEVDDEAREVIVTKIGTREGAYG